MNILRKLLPLSLITAGFLTACSPNEQAAAPATTPATPDTPAVVVKQVAITSFVEHPALNLVRQGVIEELAEQGFKEGENLKVNFQSAQGNAGTASQIAKQFVGSNPDVIIAIATPSAQAIKANTDTIPLVFSAVTDPVEAKLVPSWEASGTNVTGVSDLLPLEPQIDLMKKVVPNLKSVGYVYSPGEVNSTIVLKQLTELLEPQGIKVVAKSAEKTVDIPNATKSLKGKADLIYTSLDNNVVSAYESMYQAAKEVQIPLVASDTDSVPRGAVAALGVNYKEVGRETGKIAADILNGTKAGEIKPRTMEKLDLHVSPNNAKVQGIELSEELVQSAQKVVEDAAK
ncbi:MAG: ABC transporter substrate-binding protein [Neisseriaceae bacterium]|nr:ABC transporter substrate-binding protein [Neisseriaceae bacterium]